MIFAEHIVDAVFAHAKEELPRECCGLIVQCAQGQVYLRSRNAREGNTSFEITGDCWAAAEDIGEIIGVAHSHPFVSPEPSQADLVGCEASGLPWLIVNYPTKAWNYFAPTGYKAPLIGRAWSHGLLDCYSLVKDYFEQTCGISLGEYDREDDWWHKGQNLYRENILAEGFVEVEGDLRPHDLLLMRIRAPVDNHAAIYVGNSTIIHHLHSRLSRREIYGAGWRKCTTGIFRHKALL